MKFKQFDIWLADLNPTIGTEPGKTRPVVIIQTDLLNEVHFSTIICPITTNVNPDAEILRIHLKKIKSPKPSDILVDQPRAIDNRRFIKRLGKLTADQADMLKNNLKIILGLS
jgi:mRNA interferase MazF